MEFLAKTAQHVSCLYINELQLDQKEVNLLIVAITLSNANLF